jgi:hypothetical protein
LLFGCTLIADGNASPQQGLAAWSRKRQRSDNSAGHRVIAALRVQQNFGFQTAHSRSN